MQIEGNGIYLIINLINNKIYVGSAIKFKIRWRIHTNELNRNCHGNKHLQAAWNKYGQENFKFVIIEYTSDLIEKEQYWIDKLQVCNRKFGYNIVPNARTQLGYKHTNESKNKMSISKLNMSEETKKKMSISQTGLKRSELHVKNAVEGKKGYKHSQETKLKISNSNKISQKGKVHSEETKLKMSLAKKGKKKSEQAKLNMIEVWKKRKLDKWSTSWM